jgi:hypothetical protein
VILSVEISPASRNCSKKAPVKLLWRSEYRRALK